MIVPLAKHLRKWLLGLAIAAQNRIQAIVAGLAPAEEELPPEAEREIAPGGAKTARPGGPPDHWVQLVKRHAPELLQLTDSYVVTREPSPLFETGPGMDEAAAQDTRDQRSVNGAMDGGNAPGSASRADASKPAQLPQGTDDPGGKEQMPVIDDRRQKKDTAGSAGVAAAPSRHPRDDAAPFTPAADQPGSGNVQQSPGSALRAEKKAPKRPSGPERDDRSIFTARQRTEARETETSEIRTAAAPLSQLTAGQIEKTPAGTKNRRITRPDAGPKSPAIVLSDRRVEQVYLKMPDRRAGSQGDTGPTVHRPLDEVAGHAPQPGPGGFLKESGSSPDSGAWPPGSQTKSIGNDPGQVDEVPIIFVRRSTELPQDEEKAEEKISPAAEFCWPSLPGEEVSEDVRDAHLAATWPSLSAERPSEVTLPANQMELHPTEAETRNIERLRRLDEEQKGRPWSASHF